MGLWAGNLAFGPAFQMALTPIRNAYEEEPLVA